MHTILHELLAGKGYHVETADPELTVYDAVLRMLSLRIGCLLVVKDGHIVGLFSERDLLIKIIPKRLDPEKTLISDVMTHEVLVVEPTTTVEEAMSIMTEKRVRHLPVMEDSVLIGLISIGDITKWLSHKHHSQVQEIDDLVRYINGGYSL